MASPRINLSLVIVALVFVILGCVSFFVPVSVPFRVRPTDWGVVHFFDGRFRMFWIESHEAAIKVESLDIGPNLRVTTTTDIPPLLASEPGPEPPRIDPPAIVRIGSRRELRDFGGRWHWAPVRTSRASVPVQFNYFRVPVWLPVILLLILPVRGIVRGPWVQRRRQRRGQCLHCGYSRKGLTGPRCPECGTPVDSLTG